MDCIQILSKGFFRICLSVTHSHTQWRWATMQGAGLTFRKNFSVSSKDTKERRVRTTDLQWMDAQFMLRIPCFVRLCHFTTVIVNGLQRAITQGGDLTIKSNLGFNVLQKWYKTLMSQSNKDHAAETMLAQVSQVPPTSLSAFWPTQR